MDDRKFFNFIFFVKTMQVFAIVFAAFFALVSMGHSNPLPNKPNSKKILETELLKTWEHKEMR